MTQRADGSLDQLRTVVERNDMHAAASQVQSPDLFLHASITSLVFSPVRATITPPTASELSLRVKRSGKRRDLDGAEVFYKNGRPVVRRDDDVAESSAIVPKSPGQSSRTGLTKSRRSSQHVVASHNGTPVFVKRPRHRPDRDASGPLHS